LSRSYQRRASMCAIKVSGGCWRRTTDRSRRADRSGDWPGPTVCTRVGELAFSLGPGRRALASAWYEYSRSSLRL
jgi:hypothetical protein